MNLLMRPTKLWALEKNLQPIESILEGEQAPFSGIIMTRDVFNIYENKRHALDECKENAQHCTDPNYDTSKYIAAGGTTMVLFFVACSFAHCRF